MSLYDLFEHTQLVIVPMVDYLPAPASPDNWGDWHFYVKTFGPGLVTTIFTGTIASMALIVALTQRKIAANKYNLDLFDKRHKIFDEIVHTYKDIKLYKLNDFEIVENNFKENNYKFHEMMKKQESIIKNTINFPIKDFDLLYGELEKASRIFFNVKIEKISFLHNNIEKLKKDLSLFLGVINLNHEDLYYKIFNLYFDSNYSFTQKQIDSIKKAIIETENNSLNLKNKNLDNKILEDIIKSKNEYLYTLEKNFMLREKDLEKYKNYMIEIHESTKEMKDTIIGICQNMERQLTISHKPY